MGEALGTSPHAPGHPRAIWDRQTSLTPNLTGQSGQKSGSFLGQCFFATALELKRTRGLELV